MAWVSPSETGLGQLEFIDGSIVSPNDTRDVELAVRERDKNLRLDKTEKETCLVDLITQQLR